MWRNFSFVAVKRQKACVSLHVSIVQITNTHCMHVLGSTKSQKEKILSQEEVKGLFLKRQNLGI